MSVLRGINQFVNRPASDTGTRSARNAKSCKIGYAGRNLTTRETLHEMIDQLPDSEMIAVQRALEPQDDEPVTPRDADAMLPAQADVETGRVASHNDILLEFGIRRDLSGLSPRAPDACID